MRQFIKECLSEKGEASSKRVVGVAGLALLHLIAVYAVVRYGVTSNVESVLITLTLMDGALLGITTIANAMK